ncbi:MAG: hypothetical protein E6J41_22470 [Chloroflexi bacterium]|nr:MAG: hypothetical protein E6J41_22470 [Chloroflexota bacterium]
MRRSWPATAPDASETRNRQGPAAPARSGPAMTPLTRSPRDDQPVASARTTCSRPAAAAAPIEGSALATTPTRTSEPRRRSARAARSPAAWAAARLAPSSGRRSATWTAASTSTLSSPGVTRSAPASATAAASSSVSAAGPPTLTRLAARSPVGTGAVAERTSGRTSAGAAPVEDRTISSGSITTRCGASRRPSIRSRSNWVASRPKSWYEVRTVVSGGWSMADGPMSS